MSETIRDALATLSIGTAEPDAVSHAKVESQADWHAALAAGSAPKGFRLLKTLVFKPKTAKSETPVPLVVITDDATQTNTAALGAALKVKDLRLAAPELLQAVFGASKDTVSPFSVTKANAGKVRVAIDAKVANSYDPFAVHANSAEETVFVPGKGLGAYLESTGAPVEVLAFDDLAAAAPAPPRPKAEVKTSAAASQDAKIADAELIGITVRKDLDFPEWYQQVLRKGDMLDYYDVSGCYILKPLSFYIWESIQRAWCWRAPY